MALSTEAVDQSLQPLLAWLDPDPDLAGRRYVRLQIKLTAYFEWRGCDLPDARADEALARMTRRIAAGEQVSASPEAYAYGIARLLAREAFREQERQRRALAQAAPPPPTPVESERDMDCLEACLARLASGDRELIVRYYSGGEGERIRERRRLAAGLGLSATALRLRAFRLRFALQACVEGCRRETERSAAPRKSEGA